MKAIIRIALLAFAPILVAPCATAQDPMTPTAAKGVQVVSVEQARDLMGKARFFDVRLAINYGKGHIKGAVALPYTQRSEMSESFDASKDKFDLARLPGDKSLPIVFYSDGPTGWKSYKAALAASRAGHSNVKWLREGTAGWTEKGIALE